MKQILLILASVFTISAGAQQCYSIAQISYNPDPYNSGNFSVPTIDDLWSVAYPIGFPFCFMGTQVSYFVVGSNGVVSFDTTQQQNICQWPIAAAIPTTPAPRNCIMLPWQDLYTSANNSTQIYVATYGNAPSRRLVISYNNIPYYSCITTYFTGQVILYETTHEITINIQNRPMCTMWNGGYGILGLHNANATAAEVVPGRNFPATWTATNEAWNFSPICNVCAGVGIDEPIAASEKNLTVYPNPASDYISLSLKNADGRSRAEICDLSGRVIISQQILSASQQKIAVNELPAGFYFIRIRNHSGEISETGTFVKE